MAAQHGAVGPIRLFRALGIPAVVAVGVNCVLCAACGSWSSPRSHPLVTSMGVCLLAAALLCATAALSWQLTTPPARLFALPAVLLAALLWVCTGTALAHLAWLLGCIQPDWCTSLLFAVPPTLAGAAALWLVLSGQPHRLAQGAIRAAAGANMYAYLMSFFVAFGPLSLSNSLIFGGVLGLLDSSTGWDVARHFLPAVLLPHVENWTRDGLVADGLQGMEALQQDKLQLGAFLTVVALGMAKFELWMFWVAMVLKKASSSPS